ncbi:unnamed protein product, partial [Hapterophycus canaliculatus]
LNRYAGRQKDEPKMRKPVTLLCYFACLAVDGCFSFLVASGKPWQLPIAGRGRGASAATAATADPKLSTDSSSRDATARQQHSFVSGKEVLGMVSSTWIRQAASAVVAVSVLAVASATAPAAAAAAMQSSKQEPVVQALVQLPDEEADWTKLLSDAEQAPGARMVITASREIGGKPSLGASIAMNRLRFPVMLQLFPRNAIGGASWPVDFQEQGTYAVEVRESTFK